MNFYEAWSFLREHKIFNGKFGCGLWAEVVDVCLDCSGDTFEEAIIELAKRVKENYNDNGTLKTLKAAKEVENQTTESDITELEKKVKNLELVNKKLKKSNKNWRRKVQRLRNHENEYETKEAEIESLLFRLNRLGYKPEGFKKELEIARQFIIDNNLLYELALYSRKFEEK